MEDDDDLFGDDASPPSKRKSVGKKKTPSASSAKAGKGKAPKKTAAVDEDDDVDVLGDDDERAPAKSASVAGKKSAAKSSAAKVRATKKRRNDDDDDNDDDDFDQIDDSVGSSGSARGKRKQSTGGGADGNVGPSRKFAHLPEQEQSMLVGEVVRFMLMRHRIHVRVTREDISKLVLGERYKGMKITKDLTDRARTVMLDVFGLHLKEHVERQRAQYFLTNAIPLEDPYAFFGWMDPDPSEGFAAFLVGLIHCSRTGRMEESELLATLNVLGFFEGREHEVFGNWQDLLKKMCSEWRYLTRTKDKNTEGDTVYFYSLGPRAEVETTLPKTEGFVSRVFNRPVDEERIREKQIEWGVTAPITRGPQPKRGARANDEPATGKRPTRRSSRGAAAKNDDEDDDDEEVVVAKKKKTPSSSARKGRRKARQDDEDEDGDVFDDEDDDE